MFLFYCIPGEDTQWPVIIGVIVTLGVGEIAILISEAEKRIRRTNSQGALGAVSEE